MLFRLVNAFVRMGSTVAAQPWPSIAFFILGFQMSVSLTRRAATQGDAPRSEVPWPMIPFCLVVGTSVYATLFWAMAWILSALALIIIAFLDLFVTIGGFRVLEHYVIHPIVNRLTRWLGRHRRTHDAAAHDPLRPSSSPIAVAAQASGERRASGEDPNPGG